MHSLVAVSQLYSVQETEVLLLSYAPLVIKCALDHTYIYLHIHSVLIGDSFIRLRFMFWPLSLHYNIYYSFYRNRKVCVKMRWKYIMMIIIAIITIMLIIIKIILEIIIVVVAVGVVVVVVVVVLSHFSTSFWAENLQLPFCLPLKSTHGIKRYTKIHGLMGCKCLNNKFQVLTNI